MVENQADFTQTELMLDLLRSSARGPATQAKVDVVLTAYGTQLIIRQLNISRAVTTDQYRALLLSLSREEMPGIAAAAASERAKRGVEGLQKDVWPALRWGVAHTDLLAQRIAELRALDVSAAAQRMAAGFLPEAVPLTSQLFVVMGGRAGAATLDGNDIYFDILANSYRADRGVTPYSSPAQVTEFFVHEMHHVGLSQIIDRTRNSLKLGDRERRAFDFLSALVLEGSASYLINGHRNIAEMRRDPIFSDSLKNGDQLLRTCEQVLRAVLEKGLDGEPYEQAITPFVGSGHHCAGAILLNAADRAGGLPSVMAVLRDPRKLLIVYNESAAGLITDSERVLLAFPSPHPAPVRARSRWRG